MRDQMNIRTGRRSWPPAWSNLDIYMGRFRWQGRGGRPTGQGRRIGIEGRGLSDGEAETTKPGEQWATVPAVCVELDGGPSWLRLLEILGFPQWARPRPQVNHKFEEATTGDRVLSRRSLHEKSIPRMPSADLQKS